MPLSNISVNVKTGVSPQKKWKNTKLHSSSYHKCQTENVQLKQKQRKNSSSILKSGQYLEKVLGMSHRKAKSFVLSWY